jgi:hypothetical protein
VTGLEGKKSGYSADVSGKTRTNFKIILTEVPGENIDHKSAFGRIAIAVPGTKLNDIQNACKNAPMSVLHSKKTLSAPGKSAFTILVVTDPDKYEVALLDDDEYRKLTVIDPNAEQQFRKASAVLCLSTHTQYEPI